MKTSRWLTLVVLTFFVELSQAQSTTENAKQAFEATDARLNQVYQQAKSQLSEFEFQKVQEEQREWIDYRDYRAEASAMMDGGKTEEQAKTAPEYWQTAEAITSTRVEILSGLINAEKISTDQWSGYWEDGYGGSLMIREKDDGTFRFLVVCVRGPTYHTGSVTGLAITNGDLARFAIKWEGEEDQEAWLTFHRDGKYLKLIGANTSYFHGARAYFDGKYVRVAEIDAEDLEERIQELER